MFWPTSATLKLPSTRPLNSATRTTLKLPRAENDKIASRRRLPVLPVPRTFKLALGVGLSHWVVRRNHGCPARSSSKCAAEMAFGWHH